MKNQGNGIIQTIEFQIILWTQENVKLSENQIFQS